MLGKHAKVGSFVEIDNEDGVWMITKLTPFGKFTVSLTVVKAPETQDEAFHYQRLVFHEEEIPLSIYSNRERMDLEGAK